MWLDIFLTLESLSRSQQEIAIEVLPLFGSNLWPISITWKETLASHPQRFSMGKIWMDHEDFMPNIETWWGE